MNYIYKLEIEGVDGCYIGRSIDLKARLRTHKSQLRRGKHHCSDLQAVYNSVRRPKVVITELGSTIDKGQAHELEHAVINAQDCVVFNSPKVGIYMAL